MKQVAAWIVAECFMSILPVSFGNTLGNSRQCVVVTTDSWSATKGTMSIFERELTSSDWQERRSAIPVVIGKGGMAWGRGHTYVDGAPTKIEGDNKAPAGIFELRGVFGYAAHTETKMPYLQVSPNIVCVDDPQSRHYNQLIDKSKIEIDWHSAEEMQRKDDLYKWGVIVDHNGQIGEQPHPGAGSCIFLHIWRGPSEPTTGCTAMSEKNLVDLIRWLDPTRGPLLAQMPRPVYEEYRDRWSLPPLR
jgi:D-alanyl-D-alanine dipeptidase